MVIRGRVYIYPHLPVTYIFGTRGVEFSYLISWRLPGSQSFQIYWELQKIRVYIWKKKSPSQTSAKPKMPSDNSVSLRSASQRTSSKSRPFFGDRQGEELRGKSVRCFFLPLGNEEKYDVKKKQRMKKNTAPRHRGWILNARWCFCSPNPTRTQKHGPFKKKKLTNLTLSPTTLQACLQKKIWV